MDAWWRFLLFGKPLLSKGFDESDCLDWILPLLWIPVNINSRIIMFHFGYFLRDCREGSNAKVNIYCMEFMELHTFPLSPSPYLYWFPPPPSSNLSFLHGLWKSILLVFWPLCNRIPSGHQSFKNVVVGNVIDTRKETLK